MEAERVLAVANGIVARVERGCRVGREIHASETRDLIAAYVLMRRIVADLSE